jgi:hypothetical protein
MKKDRSCRNNVTYWTDRPTLSDNNVLKEAKRKEKKKRGSSF